MKTKKSRIEDKEGLFWALMSLLAFVLGILTISDIESNVCVSWFILGMIMQLYDKVRKI